MAIEERVSSRKANIWLNAGLDSQGAIKYLKNNTLGSRLNPDNWDAEKAWAIGRAMEKFTPYEMSYIQGVKTSLYEDIS